MHVSFHTSLLLHITDTLRLSNFYNSCIRKPKHKSIEASLVHNIYLLHFTLFMFQVKNQQLKDDLDELKNSNKRHHSEDIREFIKLYKLLD